MKPLFDSEDFSFIGSGDDRIYVHCRKCGHAADIQISTLEANGPELLAICPQCQHRRRFTFVNLSKTASTRP